MKRGSLRTLQSNYERCEADAYLRAISPDVGNAGKHALKAVEQAEPVLANGQVLIHDHDVVEERVDGDPRRAARAAMTALKSRASSAEGNLIARGVGRIQQGKLGVAHELAVDLGAELRVGEVSSARVSGSEVGEASRSLARASSRACASSKKCTGTVTSPSDTAATVSAETFSSRAIWAMRP